MSVGPESRAVHSLREFGDACRGSGWRVSLALLVLAAAPALALPVDGSAERQSEPSRPGLYRIREPIHRIRLDLGPRTRAAVAGVSAAEQAVFHAERSAVLASELSAVGAGAFDALVSMRSEPRDESPILPGLDESDPCQKAGLWPEDQHSCRLAAEVLRRR